MSHGLATWTTALAGFTLTWSVQSSALLLLGLLAGRLMKRTGPAVESGVYRTTLAAVLVCPLASMLVSAAGHDELTLRLPAPNFSEMPAGASGRETAALPLTSPLLATVKPEAPKSEPSIQLAKTAGSMPEKPAFPGRRSVTPDAQVVFSTKEAAAAIGLFVWVFGTVVIGMRLLVGHVRMSRVRAMAVPVEPAADALCRDVARDIGVAAPAVLRSPFLFSPCLDGVRKPAILLPEELGHNLRETFVHELAHLARRDGLWNVLRRLSVALFWVQPLMWVLSRRLEVAAEEVCDNYVLQFGADRAVYADHLLNLAGHTLPPVTLAAVGMVSLRSMLAQRIVRLLDPSRSFSIRAGKRAVFAMLTIGLAGTLLAKPGRRRKRQGRNTADVRNRPEPRRQRRRSFGYR